MLDPEMIFKSNIEEACKVLGSSHQQLKDKYMGYPVCLMEYYEKKIYRRSIEVRFDSLAVTFALSFGTGNHCDTVIIFFDHAKDEDLFIDYLKENAAYDFRKCSWKLPECYLKIRFSPTCGTAFYIYKEQN